MMRRLMTLTLLLAVETGCPHAWRKGGTIDMALEKDLDEERKTYRLDFPCKMSKEEWLNLCSDDNGHRTSPDCPKECRPRRD